MVSLMAMLRIAVSSAATRHNNCTSGRPRKTSTFMCSMTPIAAVVLYDDATVGADELRAWINERVAARYQRLSAVVVLDEFPRSAAGKILKRELREPYWTSRGTKI